LIIKRFKAEKVFGYLNFDISFNNDISFLVGGNGSGKTTALKLMNALVNPNLKDLIQIPFQNISLELEDSHTLIKVYAKSEDERITLKISTLEDMLSLPCYSSAEFDYYSHRGDKLEELVEEINRKYADHLVIKQISNISSPIFLGLDRRKDDSIRGRDDYYLERDLWLSDKNKRAARTKRLIRGSIGVSLMETELLVQNSYRRMRELEGKQSGKLRDGILLSAFEYTSFDENSLKPDPNIWKEKSKLLERQKEIKEALSKIGVKGSRLSTEVDNFFHEITSLFEKLQKTEEGLSIEWLLNKAQIERMSKMVEIIDEHKSKVDRLFKPINDFLSTVNDFYKDSGKELDVNTVGQLIVKRPDGNKCTIEALSSGERQLLVIFAHAYFNRYSDKSTVFIIDEPELSLHLGWQEKFAETIFSISPESQFILATHSPEIVGVNKNKAMMCR